MPRIPNEKRFLPIVQKHPAVGLIGGTRLFRIAVPGQTDHRLVNIAKAKWTDSGGSNKGRPVAPLPLARSRIFVGQFCGAYRWAALEAANRESGSRIVRVSSERGERCLNTGRCEP